MIKLIKVRKIIQRILFILLVFNSGFLSAEEDRRTPFQKISGSFRWSISNMRIGTEKIFFY